MSCRIMDICNYDTTTRALAERYNSDFKVPPPEKGCAMAAETQIERTYNDCVTIGREMIQSGHHEVAYHAWMAALHCAEDVDNEPWASALIGMFREHQRFLDGHESSHHLATRNSHIGRGIFEVGACTAEALVMRIENKRRTEEARRRTGAK
jgi:hypothetical protein